MRKDESYLDFEQVTMGSFIFVEKNHSNDVWGGEPWSSSFEFKAGDIWMVATLVGRPKIAIMRNLQRGETAKARVDELLELDDRDIITIGPA